MECMIALEKRKGVSLGKFLEIVSGKNEITLYELRRKLNKTSLYKVILEKIYYIDEALKIMKPGAHFAESSLIKTPGGRVFQGFRINPYVKMTESDRFYILNFKEDGRKETKGQ